MARAKCQKAQTSPRNAASAATALLAWYDKNARELPWRVGPAARARGVRSDPYRVWLSEIMLQQTTVATVSPRYAAFLDRWPTVEALADASLDEVLAEWAGLGYYARARNLHQCAAAIVERGGFPDTEEALRALPGVGHYTAAAIAAIAFDRRAVVVDGNIERVTARLRAIDTPLPNARPLMRAAAADLWPEARSGDFAQALMDLGAAVCRPRAPACRLCPLTAHCAACKTGEPEKYPVKAARRAKPIRRGAAFVLENARGELLFERRSEKGLLAGMLGLPTTPWTEELNGAPQDHAPAQTHWRRLGDITHAFTHFHLTLEVHAGAAPKGFRRKPDQAWMTPEKVRLPTVMKKALVLAMEQCGARR